MRTLFLPVVLLAAGVALTGCSERVDTGKAEKEIKAGYEKQVPTAKVRSVDCPDEIDAKKGTKASCDMALVNGVLLDVSLEVIEPDEPRVRWVVVGGTLPGSVLEPKAADSLEEAAGERPASVECPDRVSLKPRTKVRCTVVDRQGTRYGSTLTIKDESGAFDIVVDDAPAS